MKHFTTPLALLLAATPAFAAPQVAPPTGTLNMEAYPAGLSSFEVLGTFTLNREAEGFVCLYIDGELSRQIPASNVRDVYTFEGYQKGVAGSLHVTFYQNQQTSPYRFLGDYKVTVPAGYYFDADGNPNEAFEVEYHIPVAQTSISPAKDSKVTDLKSFTILFPGMTSVTPAATLPSDFSLIYVPEGGSIGTNEHGVPITADQLSYNADSVVVTLTDEYPAPGTLEFNIPEGTFNVTNAAGVTGTNEFFYGTYQLVTELPVTYEFDIDPAPGTYESFSSVYYAGADKYAYFALTLPDELTLSGFPSMTTVKLAAVAEDGAADLANAAYSFKAASVAADNTVYIYDSAYKNGGFAYRSEGTITPLPGDYILDVPVGTFRFTDPAGTTVQSSNVQYRYTIEAAPSESALYIIEPNINSPLQAPVKEFTLTFDSADELTWSVGTYVTIANAVTEYVLTPTVEANVLKVEIPAGISAEGVYTFSSPASALSVDGQPTPIEFQFEVGENPNVGVGTILDAETATPIYTIQGVKADPSRASKGIYVTNGKKIIKK